MSRKTFLRIFFTEAKIFKTTFFAMEVKARLARGFSINLSPGIFSALPNPGLNLFLKLVPDKNIFALDIAEIVKFLNFSILNG